MMQDLILPLTVTIVGGLAVLAIWATVPPLRIWILARPWATGIISGVLSAAVCFWVFVALIAPQGPPGPQGAPGGKGDPGEAGTSVIAGHWDGHKIDILTQGAKVTGSTSFPYVRLSFERYQFKSAPAVMLTPEGGWHTSIHYFTGEYVDVGVQGYHDGLANGPVLPTYPFWFQITPTSN